MLSSPPAPPRRILLGTALLASLVGLSGCGGRTPLLREDLAPEPASPISVTSLPPAARVEVIPIRRDDACRWQDGYYRPRSSLNQGSATEWIWNPGSWANLPDNCRYEHPHTEAERGKEGGRILFFGPRFFDPVTKKACPPPPECR